MTHQNTTAFTRRDLLSMIGQAAGGGAMYQAMTALGFAAESNFSGPIQARRRDPKGASRADPRRRPGRHGRGARTAQCRLQGQVLEYNERAGGRSWTMRGGDTYTELGGATQNCDFDQGRLLQPRSLADSLPPSRACFDYCKRLGVALEPFVQVNHNAYVHSSTAFGGKPQRFRHVRPTSRAMWPNCWPRPRARASSTIPC